MTISSGTLTAQKMMDDCTQWKIDNDKSLERWNQLDEETRATITRAVVATMERAIDTIDAWLPVSQINMEQSGQYIDVIFRMAFLDLEAEKKVHRELTQRRIAQAAAATAAMARGDA